MALELLANNAQDALSGGIDGATNPVTLTVDDASEFPSTGNFRILIDSEILLVTSVSGNDFTAARAQEGTSIAAHLAAASVTLVVTAQSTKNFISDFLLYDTFANRPAAGQANRRFIASDGNTLFRDTGSVWQSFGPVVGPFTQPDHTAFATQINHLGSSSLANSKGTIEWFDSSAQGSNHQVQMILAALPVGSWTLTAAFRVRQTFTGEASAGLCVRNSSNSRIIAYGPQVLSSSSQRRLTIYNYTSPTAFSSSSYSRAIFGVEVSMIRIRCDGTNFIFEASQDFVRWDTVNSVSIAGSHTGAGSDQIGFFMNAYGYSSGEVYGPVVYHLELV